MEILKSFLLAPQTETVSDNPSEGFSKGDDGNYYYDGTQYYMLMSVTTMKVVMSRSFSSDPSILLGFSTSIDDMDDGDWLLLYLGEPTYDYTSGTARKRITASAMNYRFSSLGKAVIALKSGNIDNAIETGNYFTALLIHVSYGYYLNCPFWLDGWLYDTNEGVVSTKINDNVGGSYYSNLNINTDCIVTGTPSQKWWVNLPTRTI